MQRQLIGVLGHHPGVLAGLTVDQHYDGVSFPHPAPEIEIATDTGASAPYERECHQTKAPDDRRPAVNATQRGTQPGNGS